MAVIAFCRLTQYITQPHDSTELQLQVSHDTATKSQMSTQIS